MTELSYKATIVLELLKLLDASDVEHKVNVYDVMQKLEETDLRDIIPNLEDYEVDNLECEMTQKSISTTLSSLVRRGLVKKTEVASVQIGGAAKNIRSYYLSSTEQAQ